MEDWDYDRLLEEALCAGEDKKEEYYRKAVYTAPERNEAYLQYLHQADADAVFDRQEEEFLQYLKRHYGDSLPDDYSGRPLAPSDVVERYDNEKRRYYYVDTKHFEAVRFSPFLAKPKTGSEPEQKD